MLYFGVADGGDGGVGGGFGVGGDGSGTPLCPPTGTITCAYDDGIGRTIFATSFTRSLGLVSSFGAGRLVSGFTELTSVCVTWRITVVTSLTR
jgi:hypothetical protein